MQSLAFGVGTTPPLLNADVIMQRVDDIEAIQRMLTDVQTRTVILVGENGVGKSTLAALIYHRLLLTKQAHMPAPHYLVWLTINPYTTLSDILAAILQGIEVQVADFYLQTLERQISSVQKALQGPEINALIILDQLELLLSVRASNGGLTSKELQLLLMLMQADVGFSRFLVTSSITPFDAQRFADQELLRTYRVSRISMADGLMLLQQGGIQGTPEELKQVWQCCDGHVFGLLLFCSLVKLSSISPGHLLLASEYQSLWRGEITSNIVALLYSYLSPLQKQILRCLSLFNEPVPLDAVLSTIRSEEKSSIPSTSFQAYIGQELQNLVGLSLVQSLQDNTLNAFFALHPLISHYIQEHYSEGQQDNPYATQGREAPSDISLDRVAGHIAVATYYYSLVLPKEQRTRLQDIEPLLYAIRHLCLGQQWQDACNLLFKEGVHQSLVYQSAWRTLITLYVTLVSGVVRRRDEGLILSHLAILYGRMGNEQQSQSYTDQALALQHEIEDTHGEAATLANQGELYRIRGEHEQAHIFFERAMLLNQQQPTQQRPQEIQLQCILLHNMGLLYANAKDYGPALSCYLQALRLTYKLQDQQNRGTILTNLGLLLFEQGQQREGVAVLLAALQLRQTLHDPSIGLLQHFFTALEQRLGSQAYASLYQAASSTQEQILGQLIGVPS